MSELRTPESAVVVLGLGFDRQHRIARAAQDVARSLRIKDFTVVSQTDRRSGYNVALPYRAQAENNVLQAALSRRPEVMIGLSQAPIGLSGAIEEAIPGQQLRLLVPSTTSPLQRLQRRRIRKELTAFESNVAGDYGGTAFLMPGIGKDPEPVAVTEEQIREIESPDFNPAGQVASLLNKFEDPWIVNGGADDWLGDQTAAYEKLQDALTGRVNVMTVPDRDHLFSGHEEEIMVGLLTGSILVADQVLYPSMFQELAY